MLYATIMFLVENPRHSDFTKLRTMLISTHMQDLKDVTQDVHYENFRAQCISQISQHAMRERGLVFTYITLLKQIYDIIYLKKLL